MIKTSYATQDFAKNCVTGSACKLVSFEIPKRNIPFEVLHRRNDSYNEISVIELCVHTPNFCENFAYFIVIYLLSIKRRNHHFHSFPRVI